MLDYHFSCQISGVRFSSRKNIGKNSITLAKATTWSLDFNSICSLSVLFLQWGSPFKYMFVCALTGFSFIYGILALVGIELSSPLPTGIFSSEASVASSILFDSHLVWRLMFSIFWVFSSVDESQWFLDDCQKVAGINNFSCSMRFCIIVV